MNSCTKTTNLLRGSLMDVRLRAVEFGGVWHWHVTEIRLPRTESQSPRGRLT